MYPGFKYGGDERTYGFPYRYDPRSGKIAKSVSSVMAEITRRFREEPAAHIYWYLLQKPVTFWSWGMIQGQGGPFVYPVVKSPYFHRGAFYHSLKLMEKLHWVLVGLAGWWVMGVWVHVFRNRPTTKWHFLNVGFLCCWFTLLPST